MAAGGGAAPPPEAVRKGISRGLFATVVVVIAVIAFVGGLGAGNLLFGGKTTTPAQSDVFVVGTNIPFPPFESFNATSGAYFGFDIDMSAMIARALNKNLSIVNFADFSVLLATVGRGGVDMAASAITSSGTSGATRNESMSFSTSYYAANQAALVKTGFWLTCSNNVCTADNLKNLTVGLQSGTTSEDWVNTFLKPLMSNPSSQIKTYTTVDTEVAALQAGTLDAVIIDVGPAKSIAATSGNTMRVAGQIITGELYSFAVEKGDPNGFLPIINSVINQSKTNGTYQLLLTKWGL